MGRVKEIGMILAEEYMEIHPEVSWEEAWKRITEDPEIDRKLDDRIESLKRQLEKKETTKKEPEGFCTLCMTCSHRYVCKMTEDAKKIENDFLDYSTHSDIKGVFTAELKCKNKSKNDIFGGLRNF